MKIHYKRVMKMSDVPFSAEETLKIAVLIEENGEEFYRGMASEAESEELARLFEDLAKEKKEHGERFQEILGENGSTDGRDLNRKLYGKLEDSYLEALGNTKVFTSANEHIQEAKEAENRGQLLEVAIALEKDTMLYFYDTLDRAASDRDREVIQNVIEEEKNQIRRLIKFR